MADGLPPPPSYSSLFQGDPQAETPSAPALPGDGTPRTPRIGAVGKSSSKSFSRQTSLESPFPPSHPFYPGPTGLPALSSDDAPSNGQPAAPGYPPSQLPYPEGAHPQSGPAYPSAPPPGAAPYAPGYAGASYPPAGPSGYAPPPQDSFPEKSPLTDNAYPPAPTYPNPPWGGYSQPGAAIGGPPSGSNYPPGQPYGSQTDPLLNPAYPPVAPGATHYNATGGQYPPGAPGGPPVGLPEIPIIIEDRPEVPINPRAPQQCVMGLPTDYPDMQIAAGQRQQIDQLDPHEKPALGKWCCVAFWSIGAHVCFAVCIFLLVWQVPLKQSYDAWASEATYSERRLRRDEFEYNSTTLICASVFLCLCWLIAVIEGCASDTDTYVQNVSQLSDFRQDHGHLRRMVPTVVWRTEAFHTAKERIEWKNGVIVSRRRSSDTHKCVTYQEEIAFPFSKCVDASGPFDNFKQGVINRIEFEKTFGFLDGATAAEYQAQKALMIERVKNKDEDHSFEESLVLPEYKERATVYMEEGCRTTFMSSDFYNCLTCILCTWPYRIFFRLSTTKRKYTFVKLIGI